MVIVDVDHPDIEQYIDWKVLEEQKVAALVTGSKINQKHLKAVLKACVNCEGSGDDCFSPEKNPALKREIKLARRAMVPDNFIKRVIQFAKQGYKDIHFPIYDTDWDSDAYLTVSGQNSNNSVRVTDHFLKAVEADGKWDLTFRKNGKVAQTLDARALWEKIGYAAWASADPGLQYHTTVNDWHTCPASGETSPVSLGSSTRSGVRRWTSAKASRACMIVINAFDKEETDFERALAQVREHFGERVFPLTIPVNPGPGFNQVLDVQRNEIITYATDRSGKFSEAPAQGEWAERVKQLHGQLIEFIAESDDSLMEKFFAQGGLSEEEWRGGIHTAIQKQVFTPLFITSAENNIGVARLMDFIAKYGSSPVDRATVTALKIAVMMR